MRVAGAVVAVLAGALVVACTSDGDGDESPPSPTTATATATPTPSATTRTPSASATEPIEADVAFGTGTVVVDGTVVPVSGDCDISREFGTQPVESLDDDVDVLLAVDNVAGDGVPDGPFALQVRLLGGGAIGDRTITSQGAPVDDGTADVTYEGPVEVAELRDRRELEFLDVATLHVETTQERVGGTEGPSTRQLVVDVTCPISRPG